MNIICKTCNKQFKANESQQKLILGLKDKGAKLAMIDCEICYSNFPVNPQDINCESEQSGKDKVWRSPISKVNGFVSYIDSSEDASFYGCGETGVIWTSKEEFY